jgi:hypothetical protein
VAIQSTWETVVPSLAPIEYPSGETAAAAVPAADVVTNRRT